MHSDFASSPYVPLFCGKEDEGTDRVTLSGHVDNQSLVSNDAGHLDAIFEGAATGPDFQADNRFVLQDPIQSAIISGSHVTTQSENRPEIGPQAFYIEGTGGLDKRDQHEERNQVEYHCRLEEHRAREADMRM